jgi:5'-nucleotidase
VKGRKKWVFFDVGNVIFNDDPLMVHVYEKLFNEIRKDHDSFTFPDLLREREKLIERTEDGKHFWTLGQRFLGKDRWKKVWNGIIGDIKKEYGKYSPLIPGIVKVIKELSETYKLGIAANQVRECRHGLEKYGLAGSFSLVLLSEEIGFLKPHPEFFLMMVERAGCKPEEIVMVGDRIDNDIQPAKKRRMKTVWVKLGFDSKGYQPDSYYSKLYMESLERVSIALISPHGDDEEPDRIVVSIKEIPEAINTL